MFRKTRIVPVGVPCKVFYDGIQFTIRDDRGIIIASGMLVRAPIGYKNLTILPAKR